MYIFRIIFSWRNIWSNDIICNLYFNLSCYVFDMNSAHCNLGHGNFTPGIHDFFYLKITKERLSQRRKLKSPISSTVKYAHS